MFVLVNNLNHSFHADLFRLVSPPVDNARLSECFDWSLHTPPQRCFPTRRTNHNDMLMHSIDVGIIAEDWKFRFWLLTSKWRGYVYLCAASKKLQLKFGRTENTPKNFLTRNRTDKIINNPNINDQWPDRRNDTKMPCTMDTRRWKTNRIHIDEFRICIAGRVKWVDTA